MDRSLDRIPLDLQVGHDIVSDFRMVFDDEDFHRCEYSEVIGYSK